MQPAIRIENLAKRYKIGLKEKSKDNFREALVGLATFPIRRLLTLRERASDDETIWALRDVSFEVAPGEVVGVIGRNGAGKTTLLKILSQITDPTKGRVELCGRVASLLEVGTGFHPELTGRENIYLNGAILGMKKTEIDRKFDEIVAFAEIEKFLDTPVKRYSSGMYVRLAFAVAAHLDPEILLVDEVLAVGDAQFQKRCLGKMKDVASGGRTVLLVSHNMASIAVLCSRCLHLASGSIVSAGPSSEVIADYHKELFAPAPDTPGTRSDSGVEVCEIWINGNKTSRVQKWDPDSEADIRIDLLVQESLDIVGVDCTFYSDSGTRLFTFQSDRQGCLLQRLGSRVRVELKVLNVH